MSIFKNFDPDASRIKKLRANIDDVPEIRGLIPSKIPDRQQEDEDTLLLKLEETIKKLQEEKQKEIERLKEEQQKLLAQKEAKQPFKIKFREASVYGDITFEYTKNTVEINKVFEQFHVHKLYNREARVTYENYKKGFRPALEEIGAEFINFEPIEQSLWKIKKGDKHLVVQWNPIANPNGAYKRLQRVITHEDGRNEQLILLNIPGIMKTQKYYTVPFSEGWRLFEIHPDLKSDLCEWESLELIEEVKKEFEKRLRVKQIHTAEDSDVDVDFHDSDFHSRAHQRVAFEFQDLVGHKTIIAYGTGTGKTAIGIGAALREGTKRNLVLCPGALRLNWAKHIQNLTGIEPLILAGRTPTKWDIRYLLKEKPQWVIINYDIIRTKVQIDKEDTKKKDGRFEELFESEAYFPWVEALNLYMPEYIIVDESHYARNPSANQSQALRMLEAPRKVALSGTPIVNKPGELWSILNWLYPEQFPYYETFLNQYGWGRSIGDYEAKQLRSLLDTIMIKRMRKDISKNLPPVNRIVETFEMSKRARQIYDRILDGIYLELAEFDHLGEGGQERRFKSILPKLNAMIKVCAADKVNNTVERATEIADSLEGEKWNKVLIFTHFKGTCNTIARKLGHEALSFVDRRYGGFYTATMEERMKIVEQFQNDDRYKYLVVTRGSAAEGLDITAAGVVMFNDLFWTPAAHIQCEGRPFYRESDMHGGDSYYLQFNDSIEEWITELQGIKSNTIDKIVEGKGMGHSVTNEIMNRLKEMWKKRTNK